MNKKQSVIILTLMAAITTFAATSFYLKLNNEEGKVYLGHLKYYKNTLNNTAYFSGPTSCGNLSYIDKSEFPQELLNNYKKINGRGSKPISLGALEGFFNIVSLEDAKLIHKNEEQLLRHSNKNLVRLSRVAFNKKESEALFCLEPLKRGYLIYMVKEKNEWKLSKGKKAWGH